MDECLELIALLAGGYRVGQIHAIREIIRFSDHPISVRHLTLQADTANAAYLDLNELTMQQVRALSIYDIMWKRDKQTGFARIMEDTAKSVARQGGGMFAARVIGGRKEPIVNEASLRVIGGYAITVLRPLIEAPETDVPPSLYPASRPSCTTHRIDVQPIVPVAKPSIPCRVLQWPKKLPR